MHATTTTLQDKPQTLPSAADVDIDSYGAPEGFTERISAGTPSPEDLAWPESPEGKRWRTDVEFYLTTGALPPPLVQPRNAPRDPLADFEASTVTGPEFMDQVHPPLTWLVDGMILAGGLGLLLAADKAGKSLLTLDAGVAIATGHPFMGRKTTRVNVLVDEAEGTPGGQQERVRKMFGGVLPSNLYIRHRAGTDLTNQHLLDGLEAFITKHQIGLAFIGPLAQVGNISDENLPKEMNAIFKALHGIITRTGASICLLHHRNKGKLESMGVRDFFNSSRGSSAFAGAIDYGVGLLRDPEEPQGKMFFLQRDGMSGFTHYRLDPNSLRVEPAEAPISSVADRNRTQIEDYLYTLDGPAKVAAIAQGTGLSKSTVNDHLAALATLDHVIRHGDTNRSYTWSLTEDRRKQLDLATDPSGLESLSRFAAEQKAPRAS